MFTIKHIDVDGHESALAVLSWQFDSKKRRIVAPAPDGVTKYFYWTGRVYVMNDLGKTVGDYDFTKEQQR